MKTAVAWACFLPNTRRLILISVFTQTSKLSKLANHSELTLQMFCMIDLFNFKPPDLLVSTVCDTRVYFHDLVLTLLTLIVEIIGN